jgi:uroporphyrinogen-III synthase
MIYILSQKEYEGAKNLPCIVINYLEEEIDLKKYDALVFTSKNGVEAIDKITKGWRKVPCYSIGSGTSGAIKKLGGKVEFEAKSSYGDNFAQEIKKRLKGKKVLFLRAKVVTSKLNIILKEAGVLLDEKIVYETVCNDCKNLSKPPKNSCIVFSSPSTIECFFNCFSWDKSYKAVVIGEVTLKALPKNIPYFLSDKTTIPSCIEKCNAIT